MSRTATATSFAWLLVIIRGLSAVVPRKVVKIGWESNFGELLMTMKPGFDAETICKVTISRNEQFVDPVHEVEVSKVGLNYFFYY